MSEWNMLVKKIFDQNRAKNTSYRLGDAMRDAKKVYKKTSKTAKEMVKAPFGKMRRGRRTHRRRKSRGRKSRGRRHRGGEGDGEEGSKSNSSGLFGLFNV